jgi:hypothetical protein
MCSSTETNGSRENVTLADGLRGTGDLVELFHKCAQKPPPPGVIPRYKSLANGP